MNIYRSLKICTKGIPKKMLVGPFLIDIDNSRWGNGYVEDLNDTLDVARKTAMILTNDYHVSTENIRIFCSGRKGFNIEVRPEALNIAGFFTDQVEFSAKKLDDIINVLRRTNGVTDNSINVVSNQGTVIDRIYGDGFINYELKHPYIRLHRSINKWVRHNGNEMGRMKIEVSINELFNCNVEDISSKAEKLASNILGSQ